MPSPSCRWRRFLFLPKRSVRSPLTSLLWCHRPKPPTHTQLPLPHSHGCRSERDKVLSVLVVQNEVGGLCSLIFWRLGAWRLVPPAIHGGNDIGKISISHLASPSPPPFHLPRRGETKAAEGASGSGSPSAAPARKPGNPPSRSLESDALIEHSHHRDAEIHG